MAKRMPSRAPVEVGVLDRYAASARAAEGRRSPPDPGSAAATSRAALDLATNLREVVARFDALRAVDADPVSNADRVAQASIAAREGINFLLEKWDTLAKPIPTDDRMTRPLLACRESLRNLRGMLTMLRTGDRSLGRPGAIPTAVHLYYLDALRDPARQAAWRDQITRWNLGEADVRAALAALVEDPVATPPAATNLLLGVPLSKDHEVLLAAWKDHPRRCVTAESMAISGKGQSRNRETVGKLCADLMRMGMLNQPHGKQKGYALTDQGVVHLGIVPPAQSPTHSPT